MSDSDISVVHFADRDEKAFVSAQQQITEKLSSGRDVVLVCADDVVRRSERMTLATLAYRSQPGRFAIVASNSEEFTDTIPPAMAEHLHVFSSQDAAIQWLRPHGLFLKSTELYSWLN